MNRIYRAIWIATLGLAVPACRDVTRPVAPSGIQDEAAFATVSQTTFTTFPVDIAFSNEPRIQYVAGTAVVDDLNDTIESYEVAVQAGTKKWWQTRFQNADSAAGTPTRTVITIHARPEAGWRGRFRAQLRDGSSILATVRIPLSGTLDESTLKGQKTTYEWDVSSLVTSVAIQNRASVRFINKSSNGKTVYLTYVAEGVEWIVDEPPDSVDDPVIVAAGDIVCAGGMPSSTGCQHAATADLIGQIDPARVLALGDIQYENGEFENFMSYYDPTWGRFKSLTSPVAGNHEYNTSGATGYYDYFNGVGVQTGPAGDRSKGYYSYDLGSWHIVALNSNCIDIGGCKAGSPQEQWLRSDLAANPAQCTLAYWHHPRFSSGQHGNIVRVQPLWKALYDAGADLILVGHDHDYERFAPQTAGGTRDDARGIRQIVVGTGGKSLRPFVTILENSEVRNDDSFGVLKVTLRPTSYDWQFVPIPGDTLSDSGSTACH